MNTKKLFLGAVFSIAGLVSTFASANPITGDTCGVPDRTATLSGAAQCAFGGGNPDASDIAGYYGGVWAAEGELTSDGTSGHLTASSDLGWGVIPNSGTWAIDSSFWAQYDHAVITMHVGNGGGDPDHWAWLLSDGADSGSWSIGYVPGNSTKGGGLSNIRLWGVRDVAVPEPQSLALIGLGLIGVYAARRRKTA